MRVPERHQQRVTWIIIYSSSDMVATGHLSPWHFLLPKKKQPSRTSALWLGLRFRVIRVGLVFRVEFGLRLVYSLL